MLIDALNDVGSATLKEKILSMDGASHRLEKVASLDVDDRGDLTKEAFAWPDEKMFPIYSPSHALVSSVYLEGNENVPQFVKEACEEACALFGYDVQIDSLEKNASEVEELEASDFLLPAQRKLPVVDADTLRMSKSALEKVASDLSGEDLVIANRQLLRKADELGEGVDERVQALGLEGTINIKLASEVLHDRKLETGDSEYAAILDPYAGETIYAIEKIANIVFRTIELDEKNNLEKTAEESILSFVTPGVQVDSLSLSGVDIPIEKIASIDAEAWTDIYSVNFVESLFETGTLDQELLKEASLYGSPEEEDSLLRFISQHN